MPIDATRKRRASTARTLSGEGINKRTPLEQAIAEKTDRNARYEAKKRKQGLKRSTFWCREDLCLGVLGIAQALSKPDNDADRAFELHRWSVWLLDQAGAEQ